MEQFGPLLPQQYEQFLFVHHDAVQAAIQPVLLGYSKVRFQQRVTVRCTILSPETRWLSTTLK